MGYGMALQAMTTYLVFFGTSILKMQGSVLGLIISISVIWDAFSDPIMGTISDYTHSRRFGRRHLYIMIGSFGVAFFNAILWSLRESMTMTSRLVLITVMIFGVKTMITVFVTPYLALGGELVDDYYQRTTIQSIRSVFFSLGLGFVIVVGMTVFLRSTENYPIGQLNPNGYMYLGFTTSLLVIMTGMISYFSTVRFIPELNARNDGDKRNELGIMERLKTDIAELWKNGDYLMVALGYLSANIASALIGSIGMHVFTYTFRLDSYHIGVILGVMFLFNIISQPFWIWYSKKVDKRNAALLATVTGVVACLFFFGFVFAKGYISMHPYYLLIFTSIAGIGGGGLLTLPYSMVNDTIDIEEYHTGRRSEGLYIGGMTFSYKFSQAITIFIIGILLDVSGFNPELGVQTSSTETALGLILAVGGILAFILTFYAYYRYKLNHEYIENIRNRSKERQHDYSNE